MKRISKLLVLCEWNPLATGPVVSLDCRTSSRYADDTVYPKKYAHGFCFAVLCSGYTLTDFPISIRLISLALWQSNDCPSASKATLMNMDKYFMGIHYERLHNHNKAKHNKTVCIFLGIYCILHHDVHVTSLWCIYKLMHKYKEKYGWQVNYTYVLCRIGFKHFNAAQSICLCTQPVVHMHAWCITLKNISGHYINFVVTNVTTFCRYVSY